MGLSDLDEDNEEEEEEPNNKDNMLKKYDFDLIKKTAVTDQDREIFGKIDQIVNIFQQNFPDFSKGFIIDALKNNSLNLRSTFKYLKNPEKMKGEF